MRSVPPAHLVSHAEAQANKEAGERMHHHSMQFVLAPENAKLVNDVTLAKVQQ